MARGTWGGRRKGKSWWTRRKPVRDFVRSFTTMSYEYSTGKHGKYKLKSPVSHKLIEVAQILMDRLLETNELNTVFRYEQNQFMAGTALFFTFFGIDFVWVTEHGPDKIEPWSGDSPVMDDELLEKYRKGISKIDPRNILQEAFLNIDDDACITDSEEVTVCKGDKPEDIRRFFTMLGDVDFELFFEEIDFYYEIEKELRKYFVEYSKPIIEFDAGEKILSSYDVEYGYGNGGILVFVIETGPWTKPLKTLHHEILQKVFWKDVDLPFHAWDMGFSDGPVDE